MVDVQRRAAVKRAGSRNLCAGGEPEREMAMPAECPIATMRRVSRLKIAAFAVSASVAFAASSKVPG
ncbi:hypothetical protein QP176_13870 [Sphingomonas aerolata]